MDQITFSYTASSSSSSCSYQRQYSNKIIKSSRQSYLNSLHSVHKGIQKPMTKHFIAPFPPTPPKIYDVSASDFKEVVHMLTSSPKFQSPSTRRLKDIVPQTLDPSRIAKPALSPNPTPKPPPPMSESGGMMSSLPNFMTASDFCDFLNESLDTTMPGSNLSGMDFLEDLSPDGLGSLVKQGDFDSFGGTLLSPVGFGLSTSFSWC